MGQFAKGLRHLSNKDARRRSDNHGDHNEPNMNSPPTMAQAAVVWESEAAASSPCGSSSESTFSSSPVSAGIMGIGICRETGASSQAWMPKNRARVVSKERASVRMYS